MKREDFDRAFALLPAYRQKQVIAFLLERLTELDAKNTEKQEQDRIDTIAATLLAELDI